MGSAPPARENDPTLNSSAAVLWVLSLNRGFFSLEKVRFGHRLNQIAVHVASKFASRCELECLGDSSPWGKISFQVNPTIIFIALDGTMARVVYRSDNWEGGFDGLKGSELRDIYVQSLAHWHCMPWPGQACSTTVNRSRLFTVHSPPEWYSRTPAHALAFFSVYFTCECAECGHEEYKQYRVIEHLTAIPKTTTTSKKD